MLLTCFKYLQEDTLLNLPWYCYTGYPVPRNPWRFEAISDTRIQVLNVAVNQRHAGGGTFYGTVMSRPLKSEGFHRLTCMIDSSHLRAQAV